MFIDTQYKYNMTSNYSPSHVVQITNLGEFLYEYCEEKSETLIEF